MVPCARTGMLQKDVSYLLGAKLGLPHSDEELLHLLLAHLQQVNLPVLMFEGKIALRVRVAKYGWEFMKAFWMLVT